MQRAADMPEVIVSEDGAYIPAHVLRTAGIQTGDRLVVVRTTGGSLAMIRATPTLSGPSLRTVAGICPRPAGVSSEADQLFLHDIRYGDGDL
jgi:bifunctional DNA-binding transcriptional regulator/antitoxin component of YhaV-PrlF toxin-antitoxin module